MKKVLRNSFLNIKGFTLIELLVVMAILSVLVSIIAGGFRSSQMRGRDAQRKSDFKQIANALELFYADYGRYPDDSNGMIVGCPFVTSGSSSDCVWGEDEFTDLRTTYFKMLPIDPVEDFDYIYRIVDSPSNQKYQLFARLENTEDQDCMDGDCENPPVSYSCGEDDCNFSLTSPNTSPTE